MGLTFKDIKSTLAMEKKDTIPQDIVELLSDKQSKATIRPMTVKEQREILKAMEKRDEILINQAFDVILDKCVVNINNQGFDNNKLYIQDRIYLLLKIHRLTNGNKSKITHINPVTGKPVPDIEIDLDECMKLKYCNEKELSKVIEISPSIRITLEPATRKDEKDIEKYLKGKDSIIDHRYAALAALIKKIEMKNKETDKFEVIDIKFDDKVSFITDGTLQPTDLKIFEEYAKSIDFGISVKFNFETEEYKNPEEEANILSFFIM